MFLKKAKDPDFWRTVRTDSRYRFFIDDLLNLYETYGKDEIKDINYDAFMTYHKTGSRNEFEYGYYFPRRLRLNVCAILSLIYPDNEEYFSNLQNTIWAICNEYCWSLPNHTQNSEFTYNDCYIDLFAAETGYALSEIRYLLGDRMSILMNNRIHAEIEKRIIKSFINNTYNFERATNNWASVCASSVGCTFMYERPDLFESIKPRLDSAFKCFLSSFYGDGVCREGIGYWDYGFGFYTCYAQMLYEFTKGEINLFDNDKIKKIAEFPSYVFLSGGATISFADGSKDGKISYGIYGMLKNVYGDMIETMQKDHYYIGDHCGRWCLHIRAIVFYNPNTDFSSPEVLDKTYYLKDSAWFAKKNKNYGFAAKGGDNNEPHNHNDLGSFIFCTNGRHVLCDIGCGEYTKDYFGDKRYTIFCNRSLGHNVAFIDGKEQCAGKEFTAKMTYDNNILSIDMINAYPKCSVTKLVRSFEFFESKVVLSDLYEFSSPCPVSERFVTYIKPEVLENKIVLEDTTLVFDNKNWNVKIGSEINIAHLNSVKETIYTIDFTPANKTFSEFKMVICI